MLPVAAMFSMAAGDIGSLPAKCTLTDRSKSTCSCTFELVGPDPTQAVLCHADEVCVKSTDGKPECIKKIDYKTRGIESNAQETPHSSLWSCNIQCDDMFSLAGRRNVRSHTCHSPPGESPTNNTTRKDITSCYRHCKNKYGDSSFKRLSEKEQEYQIECLDQKKKKELVDVFKCDATTDLCVEPVTPSTPTRPTESMSKTPVTLLAIGDTVTPSPPTPPTESMSKTTVILLAIGGVVLGGGLIFFLVYMNRNLFFKKKHR